MIESEYDTVLSAIHWSREQPRLHNRALAVCAELWIVWERVSRYQDGYDALTPFLASPHLNVSDAVRRKALRGATAMANRLQRHEEAVRFAEERVQLARTGSDPIELGDALYSRAIACIDQLDYERALESVAEYQAISEQVQDPSQTAACLMLRGHILRLQGLPEEALAYLAQAMDLYGVEHDHHSTPTRSMIADCLVDLGKHEEARTVLLEVLRMRLGIGWPKWIVEALEKLVRVAFETGDRTFAATLAGAVLRWYSEHNLPAEDDGSGWWYATIGDPSHEEDRRLGFGMNLDEAAAFAFEHCRSLPCAS
ncbi:MAG TPA: tetratricopeptide repeat protein [Fimbriimonas sp.]